MKYSKAEPGLQSALCRQRKERLRFDRQTQKNWERAAAGEQLTVIQLNHLRNLLKALGEDV